MKSFWQLVKKPIVVLAPMEDVTDTVFRRIVAQAAPPDIFFTEFTSVDGLVSRGREEVITRLLYTENERPIVAQIWGNSPELFYKAAKLIAEMKFDGVDINAGCPQKNITSHGGGACLIKDPPRMKEIIEATKESGLPVSVKTRLGYKKISDDWIPFLLEQDLDALTIHGRTVAELSKGPAHWDEIANAAKLRSAMGKKTVIIGNGDVVDYSDGVKKCETYGTDGVMIGRGIFHNLWAFNKAGISHMDDQKELFRMMRRHIRLFDETWGSRKNFSVLKKFFKIYVQGFPHASEIREQLMEADTADDAEKILNMLY